MRNSFYENPILNSPYREPTRHHCLDAGGQPTEFEPINTRRPSSLVTPVPMSKKRRELSFDDRQQDIDLSIVDGLETANGQQYDPVPIINEIRKYMKEWRCLSNSRDWGVTPVTARLIKHWRHHKFQSYRPFFCQLEAIETVIWLTEVARRSKTNRLNRFWSYVESANATANPELLRLAMKMATGSGKTTVMAMLIAWQTINAVHSPTSKLFSSGFLIITPGITIKDRLRVLMPNDPDSYYRERELVPVDMMSDLSRSTIVITNYHSLQCRDNFEINKTARAVLQGRGKPIVNKESEGEMIRRVARPLMGMRNIVVINDEAHHCYRERPDGHARDLTKDEKDEATENNKAARLWINGIEAVKRKLGLNAVYDLSATPFFLSGSGWAEGTLFPWTISDFSLIDAIESGIVKLPRVPVDDNLPTGEVPVLRELWQHIGVSLSKRVRSSLPPHSIPAKLNTALQSLYGHYKKTFDAWQDEGIETPPVFIVVCNSTQTSKLVYEWISGWQTENENGELTTKKANLQLFSNFDNDGNPLARPNTLLIDSREIESGELSNKFISITRQEVERFKRERIQRGDRSEISDAELLREVMNTVGKAGRLGEQIRCVVSVSMLTEGWDANTVTHILGVRAFGTQLLCEQVVGRGLRRLNYDLNENELFDPEYADILGIPFDFTAKPVVAIPAPPKKKRTVCSIIERQALAISFPHVIGYRIEFPHERIRAEFKNESTYTIDHNIIGSSRTEMSGIAGKGHQLSLRQVQELRMSSLSWHLACDIVSRYFLDEDSNPKWYLFGQITIICKKWLAEGYLNCPGDTAPWMLGYYPEILAQASEKIFNAISSTQIGKQRVKAVIDRARPEGSTHNVHFQTSKEIYITNIKKCHINYVVCDSGWERTFARVAERHPRVVSYVKNQGLDFHVPYRDGIDSRIYIPDFIVRIRDDHPNGDLLNLIVEIKGIVDKKAKITKETMLDKWIPGVNNLIKFGRWDFVQLEDELGFAHQFADYVNFAIEKNTLKKVA